MCGILVSTDQKSDLQKFEEGLSALTKRGPDQSAVVQVPDGIIGFERLAIMELSKQGMQPFWLHDKACVCNGEIYGFRKLKKELEKDYEFISDSDCEIILPLYEKYGLKMFEMLDAEFVMVIYDQMKHEWLAARDPIGIRPLFYGYTDNGKIAFGSLAESLMPFCKDIHPFPIGSYYLDGEFVRYTKIEKTEKFSDDDLETVCDKIHDYLIDGVKKRMDADAKIGYLLSGGLDSSLVCAIAQKLEDKPILTYSIGMEKDAIDLKYARKVADYIGSRHTEVIITKEDVIEALPEVIRILESWDITTIRASIGMYLLCKKIKETGDVKVLLTGEISDELFGYKYTDFAPNADEFQKEAEKRIRELYMYDVLRADRCISANSLEARVPFGDLKFVRYVMSIDPELKLNKYNMGKYLLRHAFEKDRILPEEILFRDKAAFSDAVGHSLVEILKEYAEEKYSDEEFEDKRKKYVYRQPYTKESLLYREIFEQYYPDMAKLIIDYWLPNQKWEGCKVSDPSARYLSNYGRSGE
jgi:asparagine synthase (glutamine-hydrolysing)